MTDQSVVKIKNGLLRSLREGKNISFFHRAAYIRIEELATPEPCEAHDVAAACHGFGGRHSEAFQLTETQEGRT